MGMDSPIFTFILVLIVLSADRQRLRRFILPARSRPPTPVCNPVPGLLRTIFPYLRQARH